MSSIREKQKEFLLSLYDRRVDTIAQLHKLDDLKTAEEASLIQTEIAIAALEEELNNIKEEDE